MKRIILILCSSLVIAMLFLSAPQFPTRAGSTHTAVDRTYKYDTSQAGPALTVNSSLDHDDGVCGNTDCTLHEAIDKSNAQSGANTITFAIGDGVTILLSSTLPGITDTSGATTIDGGTHSITISGNHAVQVFYVFAGVIFNLQNLTIADGYAQGNGGGLRNLSNGTTLTHITFSGNFATDSGGGMENNSASPTLNNVTFSGNSATNCGGGLANFANSNPMLTNSIFSDNSAAYGGGIYDNASAPALTTIYFKNNSASSEGGGMYNTAGNPTVNRSVFQKNSAIFGGGMSNYSSSPTLGSIAFDGNTAISGGAGMMNKSSSSPTLINVTFSNNAGGYGGGMYNWYGSSPKLTNVTFNGNSASLAGAGGALNNDGSSSPQIQNSILWGDTDSEIHNNDAGSVPVITYSIVQGGYAGINNINSDPLLGTLNYFGGYWRSMPLRAGSPAVDAGNDSICPASDQRGIARPQGAHCDIGAFEKIRLTNVILYAQPIGFTGGTCNSWANACDLQNAFYAAESGSQIWVQAGTYVPDAGLDPYRTATFYLVNGVSVYGGFAGTETQLSQRNPTANITILSGDLQGNDNNNIKTDEPTRSDNSYHVVVGATGATLDGFTITGGNANGAQSVDCSGTDCGGGILNKSSSPILKNIVFSSNSATNGGGMFSYQDSHPVLTDIVFNSNSAANYCGGMCNKFGNPTLTRVIFSNNSASNGSGGMYNSYGNPTLTNVIFDSNSAVGSGGGMYNDHGNPTLVNATFNNNSAANGAGMENYGSNPKLTNATFIGNTATYDGAGMENYYSDPTLTNVTFSGNTANYHGGGIYNLFSSPQVQNSILWGDSSGEIYNYDTNSISIITDSVIQGGYTGGTNIITANPLLGTLGNYGGTTQTIPLLPGSSAINAGNATYCTSGTDQRGVSYAGACDIGAFESRGFTLAKTGGDSQSAKINTAFANPLTLSVTSAYSEPVNGGSVTFTAPASGAGVTFTTASVSIASGAAVSPVTANGVVGSYNITASTNGVSSILNFALANFDLPTATTNTATAVTATGAILNGTVNAKNNSAAITFQYGLTTAYGSIATATQSPLTGSTDTAVNKSVTGLIPDSTYHYRVVTVNSGGTTYGSDQTFTTTAKSAPIATTNTATAVTATSATLNGAVNANNDSATVNFQYGLTIFYGVTTPGTPSPVTGYTDTAVSAAISGLKPNTLYHYQVVAVNSVGATYGSDQTFITDALPTNITLSNNKIAENKPAGILIGVLTASDPNVGDTFTFSLAGGVTGCNGVNNASFQITTNQLKTKAVFDYETKKSYNVCLRVNDGKGGIFNKAFVITVTNVFDQVAKNGGFNTYTGTSKVPTSWTAVGFATTDGKDTTAGNHKDGLAAVKIIGATGKTKTLTQTLTFGGVTGDKFTFSFWVKGTSIPATGSCMGQVLFYNGSTLLTSQTKTLYCSTSTYGLQQKTLTFNTTAAYTSVKIVFTYSKATGTVWLDLASLLK